MIIFRPLNEFLEFFLLRIVPAGEPSAVSLLGCG